MATYILKNGSGSLAIGTDDTRELSAGTEAAGSISKSISTSSYVYMYGVTPAQVPSNSLWEAGSLTVEVNVTSANSNIVLKVGAMRIDNNGNTIETSALTAEVNLGTTGVKTFTTPSMTWTAGSCSDRLAIFYEFRNTATMGSTSSVTIETGTINTEVVTPISEFSGTCFPAYAQALDQYRTDHKTPILVGGSNESGTDTYLDFDINPAADQETTELIPKAEIQPIGTAFTNTATHTGKTFHWNPDMPDGRRGAALVYDSIRERFILWSGSKGTAYMTDTFECAVPTVTNPRPKWRRLSPVAGSGTPAGRYYMGSIFDSGRNRMIFFGGYTGSDTNELWELDFSTSEHGVWNQLSPGGTIPAVRSNIQQSVSHDPVNKKMYVLGGWGASLYSDVWSLDISTQHGTWTQLIAHGAAGTPSGRRNHVAKYDPVGNRLILFGGHDGASRNDTWQFNLTNNTYTQLSPGGTLPVARELHTGFYDPDNQRLVIWAGYNGTNSSPQRNVHSLALSGTLAWSNNTPSDIAELPLSTYGATTAVDTKHKVVLHFGGVDQTDDSWRRYTVFDYTNTGTAQFYGFAQNDYFRPMDAMGYAFDFNRNEMMFAGGFQNIPDNTTIAEGGHGNSNFVYNPTDKTWRSADVGLLNYHQREGQLLIYDSVGQRFIMFGGFSGDGLGHNDLWEAKANSNGDYVWTPLSPTGTKPSGRWLMCGGFDAVNNRLIVFAGSAGNGLAINNETWSCSFTTSSQGAWSQLTPSGTAPVARWAGMYAMDNETNKLYIYGGNTATGDTGQSNDLHELDLNTLNGTWTAKASGGTSRRSGVLVHDPTDNQIILFGGYNGTSVLNDTYYYDTLLNTWGSPSPATLPPARRSLGGVFTAGNLIISAGRPVTGTWYNDTWALNPDYLLTGNSTWTNLNPKIYQRASVKAPSLASGDYHWQSWVSVGTSDSEKKSYGGNLESDIDLKIAAANQPPTVTLNTADGTTFTSTTPALEFTGNDTESNDLSYHLKVVTHEFAEDFEDGVSSFTDGDSANYTVEATNAYSGTYRLARASALAHYSVHSTSDVWSNATTSRMIGYIRADEGGTNLVGLRFGVPAATGQQGYWALIDTRNNTGSTSAFQLRLDGGTTPLATATTPSVSANKWYRVEITWQGISPRITAKFYESESATPLVTLTSEDVTYTSGRIGIQAYNAASADEIIITDTHIDTVSSTDLGFTNTINGTDTDPFTAGEKIQYQVQTGDAFVDDVYKWRVRAIDPLGSNTYGVWSATRQFTVSTSGALTGQIKVWNGTSWVAKPVKVWDGASWVTKPVKQYNGTSWVSTNY